MPLTGKEKRQLRTQGMQVKPSLHIGQAGLTPAVVSQADALLSETDLVKVKFLTGDPRQRKAMAADLAERCQADLAGTVGKTALLYRPLPENNDNDGK